MPAFPKTPSPAHHLVTHAAPRIEDYVSAWNLLTCTKGGKSLHFRRIGLQRGLATIITVVRNSAGTLPRTISSIREQSYPQIEYIIVDGGSTDGTLGILRKNEDYIDLWISESDKGISDAFNKGIALASGEFIALVNADDWLESDHVSRSIECLKHSGADFAFGNLMVHATNGSPLYIVTGEEHYSRRVRHRMPAINHPTVVCRRALYARNGLYDPRYRIAMDYEWILRNHLRGAAGKYVPSVTGHMGAEGVSQRHIRESLKEVRQISIAYGSPATSAFLRFYGHLLKAHIRLLLARYLPHSLVDLLHSRLNPSYRPARSEMLSR